MSDRHVSVDLSVTLNLPLDGDGNASGARSPTPSAGSRLGRFEITGEVGSGGMGTVLAGRDPELRRTVAVKVSSQNSSGARLDRFVAEAQITAQLEHPNIVPVYDLGISSDGELFYAMRLVAGTDLGELLDRPPPDREGWTTHRLIQAFAQVCRAVAFAHEREVLHRDLKPSNIMLGRRGEVQVVDWGLARAPGTAEDVVDELSADAAEVLFAQERVSTAPAGSGRVTIGSTGGVELHRVSMTRDGCILGTPGYMSPEQGHGQLERVGPASDIFALGAILFEILTDGEQAYPGTSGVMRLRASFAGIDEPRRRLADSPSVPVELAEACLWALAPEPADRPKTALELADRIDSWIEGRRARAEGEGLLAQARESRAAAEAGRDRAAGLRAEAGAELGTIMPGSPEEQKLPAWRRLEEADGLDAQADLDEVRFEQQAHAALERCPDLAVGHELLAEHYRARHEQAEAARDARQAARFELLLALHDRGQHADYLGGTGRLSLSTAPAGASVVLQLWELRGKRLQLGAPRDLGAAPLDGVELSVGSYLATLSRPGHAPVSYPLEIRRGQAWQTARPGARGQSPVVLPVAGELGPDDRLVPAGWTPIGGDPNGAGALPARTVWIDSFVLKAFPVTWAEYVEFLNAVPEDAERFQPRATAAGPDQAGEALLARSGSGAFELGDRAPDWPVTNVDWASADAYCRWLAERDGLAWRLPCELEWEKAARGVDERYFPWGRTDDASWRLTVESHLGPPSPEPVSGHPTDCSPYGVRGLAGGVRDWILDPFLPAGPPITADGRLVITSARDPAVPHGTRGGAWSLPDWVGRACVRGYHGPIHLADLGFRVARSI